MWTNRLFLVRKFINFKSINYQLRLNNQRHLHQTNPTFLKIFRENENTHAYNILEKNPVYIETLVPKLKISPSQNIDLKKIGVINWKHESTEKIVQHFIDLSYIANSCNLKLSDPQYDNITETLLSKCRTLTDQQLSDLLIALQLWPETESPNSHNFGDLWSALDDMCLERHKNWSLEQLLFFSDHWYKLNLVKHSDFVIKAVHRLTKAVGRLTPNQFVQTMFFVNLCRKPPENIYDLQYKMLNCMDDLTIDELAILSMAFFKTKTPLREKLVLQRLIERTTEEVQNIHEISLCAILKVIRYSPHLEFVEQIEYLMNRLTPEIDRLSLLSCVHFGLLGTNCQIFHPESLQRIALKFVDNIESARLKDIERIMFTLSMFNYNPSEKINVYQIALNELYKRNEEIQKYPRCLYSCLNFLSLRQIYPLDLIEKVLSTEFLTHTYDEVCKAGRETLHLDLSLSIEVPEYSGPRLNTKNKLILAKKFTHWAPTADRKMSAADKQMFQVMQVVEKIVGGKQYMNVEHVVPHFERADIIIALDSKNKPVKIDNIFNNYILSDIKKPFILADNDKIKWIAIVIAGWNGVTRNNNKPLGINICKLRQLRTLGYEPIMISWFDWIGLAESNKEIFLRKMLGL